ncbi:hypothetical protein SAMN04489868_1241 [Pisciglobus halotolerans]|uniref:Uncharacterized protein n=1 Tax=Pisciglobus halotolerans TaxID=745365 RepID=A0A1I3CVX0_9LACT|nr:hypothetical protein SAMN04489868_1241 [Pisciglobus halotolerans]
MSIITEEMRVRKKMCEYVCVKFFSGILLLS